MPYRELTMIEIKEVLRRWQAEQSDRRIHRETGIDRKTVRRYVRQLPDDQTGWLAGARDTELSRALTLVHHRPAHPWTAGDLAREAGLSRTVLAERFRHFLGESPMAYLTQWRLQLGARALTATSRSVSQVASDVGYESEAAFNRAFKREHGLPPARYRKQKAAP